MVLSVLRPDVANARLEGTLALNHEEFLKGKQIDIRIIAAEQGGNLVPP